MRTRIHVQRLGALALVLGLAAVTAACDDGASKDDTKTAKAPAKTPAKADDGGAAEPDDEPAADDGAADDAADDAADGDDAAADAADGDAPAAEYDERVQKAADLAKAIEADPTKVDQLLEDAGMERKAYEALIFEITADPKLAAQYQAARVGEPTG